MEKYELPGGWAWTTIGEIARINHRDGSIRDLPDNFPVTFVPMAAVDAIAGTIANPEEQPIARFRKGFTAFGEGDVLFAKITPSMENGKAAVARGLLNGRGFGSTEFHVLNPGSGVLSEWLFYFIRRPDFRAAAKASFTGTAGQLRVPSTFLENYPIPLPPLPEQRRIVAKLDALFAESRTARAALDGVPAAVKGFRHAVLAAAFHGALTRRDPTDAPAAALLERVRAERHHRWEARIRAQGKLPSLFPYPEPAPVDTAGLAPLPEGWAWAPLDLLLEELKNGYFSGTPNASPPGAAILRISAVRPLSVDLSAVRYVPEAKAENVSVYQVQNSDLLFTRYNGSLDLVGVCGMVRGLETPLLYPDKLIRVRVFSEYVLPAYLELYFATTVPRRIIEDKAKSSAGQQGIAGADLKRIPVAVAPLAEQRRIVARVEALFAQADILAHEAAVVRARLNRLDARILERAFRGALVPQDPADEPAEALLARMRASGAPRERGRHGATRQLALPLGS